METEVWGFSRDCNELVAGRSESSHGNSLERLAVIIRDWRRKVTRRSSDGITEEEATRNRAAKTEQAARGSYWNEILAVAVMVEVLPVVIC